MRNLDIDRWDVLIALGIFLIALGAGLIYRPAAPIAGGVIVLAIGIIGAMRT